MGKLDEIGSKIKRVEDVLGAREISTVTMSEAAWDQYQEHVDRKERRHVWIVIVLILSLLLSNLAWMYVLNQYDYESSEVVSEDGGSATICG